MIPGGSGLDHIQNVNTQPIHEIYVEFDHRDPAGSSGSSMLSYGEYVPSCTGVNFEPFVERATQFATSHHHLLTNQPACVETPVKIIRRQWFSVTNPDVVVVHVYFDV